MARSRGLTAAWVWACCAIRRRPAVSLTMPLEAIERGEQIVVGVNAFTNSEPSPLTAGENSIMVPSAEAEAQQIEKLKTWRSTRDEARVRLALQGVAGRCGE